MLIGGMILMLFAALALWLYAAVAYYRHCMQQELLAVLAASARAGLPLHAAVRAFAVDRPEPWTHRAWSNLALGLLLPGLNLCYEIGNYRRRVLGLADELERGTRLSDALRYRWELVSRETVLAAAVGEACGRLPETLEQAHLLRSRFGTLWIGLAVHLVYPLLLALVGSSVLWFQWQFLMPQMREIIAEYKFSMPDIAHAGRAAVLGLSALAAVLSAVVAVVALAQLSSSLRWYLPGIAWYYRARVRAQILEMLSVLLGVGQPLPEAFGALSGVTWGDEVYGRLVRAAQLASQGLSPATCLRRTGLAPRNWTALLESAQQRGHLPWAMRALGEGLHRQLQRRFQRVINVACPLLVAAIGALFAIGCFASFYPLIHMIDVAAGAEWVY